MNDATSPAREAHAALHLDVDAGLIRDARLTLDDARALFDAAGVEVAQRGRGAIRIIESAFGRAVVRHYRRGGLMARLSHDWFIWTGTETTRPLREFRITRQLQASGLPVPEAIAARYVRVGLGYRADLVTLLVPQARTLAERLQDKAANVDWVALGDMLARFHAHGLWHADLNAHNILVAGEGRLLLIDFDRARWVAPFGACLRGNLDRLARSLRKLGHSSCVDGAAWRQLLDAYARATQTAHAGR